MIKIILSVCFASFIAISSAFAGIGDHDDRYYVTDEMWATEPYKKFVHLIAHYEDKVKLLYSCTAQYIAPNLILSAGHCIKKTATKYEIQNYKKQAFEAKLIATEYTHFTNIGDWAIFLVENPNFYSDAYFQTKIPNHNNQDGFINVLNAGWGWARIIKDEEIDKIRKFITSIPKGSTKEQTLGNVAQALKSGELTVPVLREEPTRLKASKCKIIFDDCWKLSQTNTSKLQTVCDGLKKVDRDKNFPNIIGTSCDIWAGNSGGGMVGIDNNFLYGVVSFGVADQDGSFTNEDNFGYIASARQFEEKVSELIKKYPSTGDNSCTVEHGSGSLSGGVCVVSECESDDYEIKDNKCVLIESEESDGQETVTESEIESPENTDQSESEKSSSKTQRGKQRTKKENRTTQKKQKTQKPEPEQTKPDSSKQQPSTNQPAPIITGGASITEAISDLEQEVENLEKEEIPDVTNSSDSVIRKIIDKAVEYEIKSEKLEELKKAYEEAKANEQSLANRTLTALTTAAMGIGGMELAMGLAEQKADKAAEQDMDAYIRTFRCTYGDGKSVKGGPDEIELPGGNIPELMSLRTEYMSLASDLKERKIALGMKPGIESEEILDKTAMSLYDDENVGITSGTYESLYRAKALNSEEDQAKIDANKKEAKNRVTAGGVLVGTGAVGGMVGNSLINGKLGEAIKEKKASTK